MKETFNSKSAHEVLVEDYYDIADPEELEQAAEDRDSEIAKAKLARIEKIVDLDADTADDLLPSYVGKVIIQCPQCMTLFYKNPEDIEHSEENPDVVNINEICQHCGNSSGYTLIGKVDKVGEDEAENYDVEDFEENELDLDFPSTEEEEEAEEPTEEETTEEETEEEVNLDEIPLEGEEEEEEEVKEESLETSDKTILTEDVDDDTEEPVEDAEDVEEVEETEEVVEEEPKEEIPIEFTTEETKDIAVEVVEKAAEEADVEISPEVVEEKAAEVVDEKVEEKIEGEDKPEEEAAPEEVEAETEVVEEEPVVEESLNEEENIDAISNAPRGNYGMVKANPKLWRGTDKYIIFGLDKAANELVRKDIVNETGKAADVKAIRDEVLNSDDNIIDVFVSRIYRNTETGEELEVELDGYTVTKDWNAGLGENLNEGANDALIDSIIASWGEPNADVAESLDDDLDELLNSDEFKTEVKPNEIGEDLEPSEIDACMASWSDDASNPAPVKKVKKDTKKASPIDSEVDAAMASWSESLTEDVDSEIAAIINSWDDVAITDNGEPVEECNKVDAEGKPLTEEETCEGPDCEKCKDGECEKDLQPAIDARVGKIDLDKGEYPDFDELDEATFNSHIKDYLTEVYSNVKDFEATECELTEGKLTVEGKITFNSGKAKSTTFEFAPSYVDNKVILEGYNKDFSDEKAFKVSCSINEAKSLITESINYSYKINETLVEGLK